MAIFYVTDLTSNQKIAINPARVSRILDLGSSREIRYGTGNKGTDSLAIKDSISKLLNDTGFTRVTDTGSKRINAVNGSLVSYVLDSSNFREIWFGSQNTVGPTTSTLTVNDTVTTLSANLGLPLVTDSTNNKKIAINPNMVYMVESSGSTRSIHFGPSLGSKFLKPAILSVKETTKQLEVLGIV